MNQFLNSETQQKATAWTAIFLFVGLLALNAFLVSPFIGWYDSGEMVGTTVCLGISHPSGQVLFHLLGKIFLLLPFGTPAYRLGFMSAACSALASVMFYLLSTRLAQVTKTSRETKDLSPRIRLWILLLTLGWSLSLPWWRYSLTPLVYALHLFLGLLILWVLSLSKPGKWFLVFFVIGIATVFRPTQFFALPFVGIAFLWDWKGRKDKKIKELVLTFLSFGLGRTTAIYLPLRSALGPEIAYADLTNPAAFFHHLFALRFSSYVGKVTLDTISSIFTQMLVHLWNDFTALGLGLLIFGLFLLAKGRKKIPVFLWVGLGWGALETIFVFTIPFPAFESHQVLLGWVFYGFCGVLPLVYLEEWSRRDWMRSASVGTALVVFVLGQSFFIGHLLDRKKERGSQDYARNILELMEPGSLYIPNEENEYFPVAGYQQSFDFKKSVDVLEPGTNPKIVGEKIKQCLEKGNSLFVSRKWPLPEGWHFRAVGPLLKVTQETSLEEPPKIPPGLRPAAFWGKIALVKTLVLPGKVQAGGKVEVTYRWVRMGAGESDSTDSVVALFADDQGNYFMKNNVFWLHDIHEGPLGHLGLMRPGYLYEEKRILFIPSDFPPGRYHLVVGLQKPALSRMEGRETYGREFYERGGFQNLDKFMGRGENNAVVQFSAAMSDPMEMGLWRVTQSASKLMDSHFAPGAGLEIEAADK